MEKKTKDSKVACLAVLEGKKLLLIKEDVWTLPGGKHEGQEDVLECLKRHLDEQLPGTKFDQPIFSNPLFKKLEKDYKLEALVYQANILGEVASEKSFIFGWFNREELEEMKLSKIAKRVVESLIEQKRL